MGEDNFVYEIGSSMEFEMSISWVVRGGGKVCSSFGYWILLVFGWIRIFKVKMVFVHH